MTRESLILQLLSLGARLRRTGAGHNAAWSYDDLPRVALSPIVGPMLTKGLLERAGSDYRLTAKGRDVLSSITGDFGGENCHRHERPSVTCSPAVPTARPHELQLHRTDVSP